MELLRRYLPAYQQAHAARQELAAGEKLTAAARRRLEAAVAAGEPAKEALLAMGVPLVKSLVDKEFRRRAAWQSQVTFEDLFQDGILGYLRALLSYDASRDYKSPTNYLGQWIITEMRRSAETMDNDFEVAGETADRFRRIRAVRSRLAGELGREPTDEEIVAGSAEVDPTRRSTMGRVARGGAPTPVTLAQVAEEREARHRVGYTHRIVSAMDDTGHHATVSVDRAVPVTGETPFDGPVTLVEQSVQDGLTVLLDAAMDLLGMPMLQKDIIRRRFGLSPHQVEQSARDAARAVGVTVAVVNDVVAAFQAHMATPGGAFHRVCSALSGEELIDHSLGWVITVLGPYSSAPKTPTPPDAILVSPLPRRSAAAALPAGSLNTEGVFAQFACPFHGRTFVGVYRYLRDVPDTRACPSCQRPSPVVATSDTEGRPGPVPTPPSRKGKR